MGSDATMSPFCCISSKELSTFCKKHAGISLSRDLGVTAEIDHGFAERRHRTVGGATHQPTRGECSDPDIVLKCSAKISGMLCEPSRTWSKAADKSGIVK